MGAKLIGRLMDAWSGSINLIVKLHDRSRDLRTRYSGGVDWASAIELGGRNVGAVFGLLNTCGIAAGVASQGFVGWFTQARADAGATGREQWDPILWAYVGVLLAGVAGWCLYRARPLDDEAPPGSSRRSCYFPGAGGLRGCAHGWIRRSPGRSPAWSRAS